MARHRSKPDGGGVSTSEPVTILPVGKDLPEKRSTMTDLGGIAYPSGRLLSILGSTTASGKPVTESTSLGVGAVVACVQILAVMTAKIPIYLYRDTKKGPVEIPKHPAMRLLSGTPSFLHTNFEMRSLAQVGVGLGGNGYLRVYRDSAYQPAEIEWLAPCDVQPELITQSTGRRFVKYVVNGIREPLTRADVVHVRSPICLDGIRGMSPIAMLRESIGTSLAQTQAAGSLMKNGSKWPGFITVDGLSGANSKPQLEDIRDEINANMTGVMNAGRIPVVGGGMTFNQLHGMSMVDAEFVNSRKLEIHEVARHYGIPAFMVDSTATSTWGSGIEQQMLGFMNLSLDSWLVNWEQSLAFTLLSTDEIQAGYYFQFDRDQLANISPATRAEFYTKMRTAGAYSPNDIRRKENEPLIDPKDGGDNYGNPNVASGAPGLKPETEPEPAE